MSERRLADIQWIYLGLARQTVTLDDQTLVAVTKAIARAIGRSTSNIQTCRLGGMKFIPIAEEFLVFLKTTDQNPPHGLPSDLWDMYGAAKKAELGWVPGGEPLSLLVDWLAFLRDNDRRAYDKVPRMCFRDMWHCQRKWHAGTKGRLIQRDLDSCPVIHRYDDGWRWVHVATDAQRDAEGSAMDHCVGQGGYDDLAPDCGIFSLRDPDGKPQVTLELRGMFEVQCQGHGNSYVYDKHRERVDEAGRRCGAHLMAFKTAGWAIDEVVEAQQAVREAQKEKRRFGRLEMRGPDGTLITFRDVFTSSLEDGENFIHVGADIQQRDTDEPARLRLQMSRMRHFIDRMADQQVACLEGYREHRLREIRNGFRLSIRQQVREALGLDPANQPAPMDCERETPRPSLRRPNSFHEFRHTQANLRSPRQAHRLGR